MMALPATVLEAKAVVSTASAGACTLTSGDAGTNRPRRLSHLPAPVAALARRLAPDGSRGAASATGFHLRPLLLGDRRWSIISR
jgi:hypothetical protein